MTLLRKALLALAGSIYLAACTSDSSQPTSPPYQLHSDPLAGLYNIPWDSTTAKAGYLTSVTMRYQTPGGPSDDCQTWAFFYDRLARRVFPESVTLNGVEVSSEDDDNTARDFGIPHLWKVKGNSDIPTFSDTLISPSRFDITSPTQLLDSVSRSSGFNLVFGNPGTEFVYLYVEYDRGTSHLLDSTIADSGAARRFAMKIPYPPNGTYTIFPSQLAGFPNRGVLSIIVAGSRSKETLVGNRPYLTRAISAATIVAFIKD